MEKAYQSILKDNESINSITVKLGYEDYETFSRAFKRKYIFSPDDMKSLLQKIQDLSDGVQKEDIHIVSLDIDDEEEILKITKELIAQKNLCPEALKTSKVFSITKKTDDANDQHIIIKNKYELKEETIIKKSLLK